MAANDTTRPATTSPTASATAPRPAARAAATRRPAARRAPRSAARRTSSRARSTTRSGARRPGASASRNVTVPPSTPIAQAQQLAERIVLIPVGAALEARDRVAEALDTVVSATSSRRKFDQQLKHFERRGGRARTQLEREVRRTRTRLEREVRHGRTRVEREARGARRGVERQQSDARKTLGANVSALPSRVETVVQNGVSVGMTLINGVQDRITKVV